MTESNSDYELSIMMNIAETSQVPTTLNSPHIFNAYIRRWIQEGKEEKSKIRQGIQ